MSTLVATCEGQFIKSFPVTGTKENYGLHAVFGLISESAYEERIQSVKRRGAFGQEKGWLYRFSLDTINGKPNLNALEGCEVAQKDGAWWVKGAGRSWRLGAATADMIVPTGVASQDDSSSTDRKIILALILLFIAFAAAITFWPKEVAEEKIEEIPEPVTVVIKKQKTVTVSQQSVVQPQIKPTQQTKRAVQQELGFLGLVGRKDLTKAVGGAQINLAASAGAGKGGNAGSGGEVLTGLGRGVRATTVGNTGVQGLGGVGTKGAGGGGGGYGDVAIGSGEGKGISAIAVSQGVGVDGGLDRHVIQATIAKYLSQVRACYEDRLRVNPGLAGTLNMDFEIGASGRLNYSKVKSSSVGDPQVGSCVAQKMMGWEFPKPRGGVNVKVNYPFALRPVGR